MAVMYLSGTACADSHQCICVSTGRRWLTHSLARQCTCERKIHFAFHTTEHLSKARHLSNDTLRQRAASVWCDKQHRLVVHQQISAAPSRQSVFGVPVNA